MMPERVCLLINSSSFRWPSAMALYMAALCREKNSLIVVLSDILYILNLVTGQWFLTSVCQVFHSTSRSYSLPPKSLPPSCLPQCCSTSVNRHRTQFLLESGGIDKFSIKCGVIQHHWISGSLSMQNTSYSLVTPPRPAWYTLVPDAFPHTRLVSPVGTWKKNLVSWSTSVLLLAGVHFWLLRKTPYPCLSSFLDLTRLYSAHCRLAQKDLCPWCCQPWIWWE